MKKHKSMQSLVLVLSAIILFVSCNTEPTVIQREKQSYRNQAVTSATESEQQITENIQPTVTTEPEVPELLSSFLKIGVIGDSLASGESQYNKADGSVGGLVDMYEHSWPQFIAREYGIEFINFSKGGLTTRTWFTDSMGYAKASAEENKCNAYIIALGVNERYKLGLDYLGSADDIDFNNADHNADTYYGNYAKIIQKMKALQPKAHFFLLTDPMTSGTNTTEFNAAVKEIAGLFDRCHLIDLAPYADMYQTGGFFAANKRYGHYNSIAYNYMGELIADEINSYMFEHYGEFGDLEFIGTDYEPTYG